MHAPANIFQHKATIGQKAEKATFWLIRIMTYLILLFTACIVGVIAVKGGSFLFKTKPPFVNVEFLTAAPETLYVFDYDGEKMEMGDKAYRAFSKTHTGEVSNLKTVAYSAGGIFPCIVGTILLVVGSMTIALILGISAAIYLSEYSRPTRTIQAIRLAILNLAGVPSIVFGLFGFAMFVLWFDWGVSLLAGCFTLAFMVLPVIITASEESLRAVPQGFREGSLALGATKWQAIRTNVLPYALSGMLTSSILGIARVAGETAPIMFTAAFVVRDELPWENLEKWSSFFFQGVMALPYHIYVVSSKIPQNEYTQRVQYGTAFVFLLVVAAIAVCSVVFRAKVRKKYKW